MKCRNCGTIIEPADARFCPGCGASVAPASSAGQRTIVIPASPRRDTDVGAAQSYQPQSYEQYEPYENPAPSPQPFQPAQPSNLPQAYQQPYQPYTPPYAPQAYFPTVLPTSTAATVSLIFGILAWTMVPLLGAIGAVIAGHMARQEIRDAGGQLGGDGMALAGLILGYLQLGFVALGICFFMLLMLIAVA